MIKILFVCRLNYCRSPLAAALFDALVTQANLSQKIWVESAGTHANPGSPADPNSVSLAAKHNISLEHHRSRQVTLSDFSEFDYILAMDDSNVATLKFMSPALYHFKIQLLLKSNPKEKQREVPDPYSKGPQGFEEIFYKMQAACQGLLAQIQNQ
jgi:protein-tyrosine phosphatase